MQTNCEKCTEKQKTVTLRTIKRLKKEYPKIWVQLQEKWDPEDKYVRLFEATYGDRWKEPVPQPTVQFANRFAEVDSNISPIPTKTTSKTPGLNSVSTTDAKPIQPAKTVPLVTSLPASTLGSRATNTKTKTENTIASATGTPLSPSTKNIVKAAKTNNTPESTNKKPSVTTKTATTSKPIITTRITPTILPVSNLGASIQATVSLGTNIAGDILRGLGALGTRVAETGADIAEVVVKNLARPL